MKQQQRKNLLKSKLIKKERVMARYGLKFYARSLSLSKYKISRYGQVCLPRKEIWWSMINQDYYFIDGIEYPRGTAGK